MNLARRSPQLHSEVPHPAVLHGIVEGLLQNPKDTKRDVRRQGAWQIVGFKVDLHSLLLAELSAEAPGSSGNTQVFQF
jgi:hypothetical protein